MNANVNDSPSGRTLEPKSNLTSEQLSGTYPLKLDAYVALSAIHSATLDLTLDQEDEKGTKGVWRAVLRTIRASSLC